MWHSKPLLKNDTFEGTVTHHVVIDVATKKKTTTIYDVVAICEDSYSTNYEKSKLDKSDEKEPHLESLSRDV